MTTATAVTPQFVLKSGCTEIEFLGLPFNAIMDDNGDPWFLAHAAALQLGFEQERYATRYLDADEIKTAHGLLKGRKVKGLSKNTKFVSEPGFYSLIFESRKPEAVAFKDWVCDVVLPSIRKNGGYINGQEQEEMSDDMLMAKALKVAENMLEKHKDQGEQTQLQ